MSSSTSVTFVAAERTAFRPSVKNLASLAVTKKVSGRFVHIHRDEDRQAPVSGRKVSLYAPGWLQNTLLATAETDEKGTFKAEFIWKHRPYESVQNIIVALFEKGSPSEGDTERAVYKSTLSISNAPVVELPEQQVELYETQTDLPALAQPADENIRPQQVTPGFKFDLFSAAAVNRIKEFLVECTSKCQNARSVQALFPSEHPVHLTAENTIEMLLNGIYPCHFRKGTGDELVHIIRWDNYHSSATPDLPNVRIIIKPSGDTMAIKELGIQFRGEEEKTYTPESPEFLKALYLFNSAALVRGEAVQHLGLGHLMVGQIALAFFRAVTHHPIAKLLRAHLDGVAEINRLGGGLIFGEDGVLNVSGLEPDGIMDLLKATLNKSDGSTFKPRAMLCKGHRFAAAEQLYWKIVTDAVDSFFKENQAAIADPKTWPEIYEMSYFLVKSSLPYSKDTDYENTPYTTWQDTNELDESGLRRVRGSNGDLKTFRYLTKGQAPEEGDIERLKQFCRYAIFMSTFWHWALHSSQKMWVLNLEFASLAPENHATEPFGGTQPNHAAKQLAVGSTLVNFKAATLVSNPNNAVYQPLIDGVLAHAEQFSALGYDITEMHACVEI